MDEKSVISLYDYSPVEEETVRIFLKKIKERNHNICELPGWKILPKKKETDAKEEKIDEINVIKYYNGKWITQNYVGILQYHAQDARQDKTIFIGSRFDKEPNYFFTNYIISKVLNVNGLLFPDMRIGVGMYQMMEQLLAIAFVNQINKAQKQGIFRVYQNFERNDAKVRGKIDVTRHIKQNPLPNGEIAYSYREYTIDNDINRIIYTAFSLLEKKYKIFMKGLLNKNRNVRDCMKQLGNVVQPASLQELHRLLKRNNREITHSVYQDWEAVRKMAIMILKNMGVKTTDKDKNEINGVLLDMTEMWELYLELILKETDEKSSLCLRSQYDREYEYGVLYDEDFEDSKRSMRPDFCWVTDKNKDLDDKSNSVKIIADAKYKGSWAKISETNGQWRDSEKDSPKKDDQKDSVRYDVFQVMSYMYTLDCHCGVIICPYEWDNKPDEVSGGKAPHKGEASEGIFHGCYKISKKCDDKFHLLGLGIPQNCENYDGFKKEMMVSEEKLRKEFAKVVE